MVVKRRSRPVILTITGSDSSGGAGVQADSRTVHALGGYAATAITAVTAQNSQGVRSWQPVAPVLLRAQIEAVLEDLPVAAIKTGLLPSAAAVRAVRDALRAFPSIPLVIDPVLGSTTGTRFLSAAGLRALKRDLFSRATLITPNWPEAAALTGCSVTSLAEAETAGRKLAEDGATAVLVKGGHATGAHCCDLLVTASGPVQRFSHRRIQTLNTHGTGCVLSAALAVGLARGMPLPRAVEQARTFLRRALRAGARTRWGQGAGPALVG
jgi:hydroxymethylpyrimidine/phosphomethylpyrimidine kinase